MATSRCGDKDCIYQYSMRPNEKRDMPLWHHSWASIQLGSAGAPDRCWGLRDAKLLVSQCRGGPPELSMMACMVVSI
jgi:hypothetical protein